MWQRNGAAKPINLLKSCSYGIPARQSGSSLIIVVRHFA